ncbi:MAG: FAD-binding oxidoreductase [Leptolyngbyaceae cyanobacterium bins.59]|nr:FAD-binding oxidoreductase [Leptolyngbyaceae cyanobacterium bins.59]
MKTYDWLIIGGGITGAALAYELAKRGLSVLILEQHAHLQGATRFGYGGIAYWSGTNALTRQLCQEGYDRYQALPTELDADFQFRELDLLLTIAPDQDPQQVAASYQIFATPPKLLEVDQACELEPLLNPNGISGALTVKHGHISNQALAEAYIAAFLRLGGERELATVEGVVRSGDRVTGVRTSQTTYSGANVVVCVGGWSRQFLKQAGISTRVYFTHAELIEVPPIDLRLQTFIMPADTQRFAMEATAGEKDVAWDQPGQEVVPPILDVGVIQFQDGSLRIGQISRALTDPHAKVDPATSAADLRNGIGQILPTLKNLSGTWHHCLVAFSCDRLPLIGPLPGVEGLFLFSGFSNPLTFVPPLAVHFATQATGEREALLDQMAPDRFH